MSPQPVIRESEEALRRMLAGFPERTVAGVVALRDGCDGQRLDAALRLVLEFYLPSRAKRTLADAPGSARLREDLGLDSLALAEAAFKLEEVLNVVIETREVANVATLDGLREFFEAKLGGAK